MKDCIVVRGGGDLASGVIHRLYQSGYRVLILECEKPSAIRRYVAFSEAVYDETACVEAVTARRITFPEDCEKVWSDNEIPLIVDETAECISTLQPAVLIDAILAKKNLGTHIKMAPLTIALGPGFTAGTDVNYIVETQRGHNLARIITQGAAAPNTGVPGIIAGYGKERVIHSPAAGLIRTLSEIGDIVEKDQILAYVGRENIPVYATLTGVLRGMIRDRYMVYEGMKIADIDPRKEQQKNCRTISDKARCIAGSVLEILLHEHILPTYNN